ncbi:hypothetical protein [Nocardioides pacificus]
MSRHTDLEARLSAAFAARAEQVTPEQLPAALAPVVPLPRRTPRLLLAAASVLLVAGVAVFVTQDDPVVQPAPDPDAPEIVIPPDVGADWGPVRLSSRAALDLDGDGTEERVRFRAEPSPEYDGRVRLETTLSGDGRDAYGVVSLGTSLAVDSLDPIDADRDGDQELVLLHEIDATESVPMVLDLRDGVLVEAPPTDGQLLRRGNVATPGGTSYYDMVRLSDYWFEDGTLRSGQSVSTFATAGMTIYRPEEVVMDVLDWRLREDGVLAPEPAGCVVDTADGRRPCAEGESDPVPELGPVAEEQIGVGESFEVAQPYPFTVRLESSGQGGRVEVVTSSGADGRDLRVSLDLGPGARLFTTPPTGVFSDGVSLLAAGEDAQGEQALRVLIQGRDTLLELEPTGPVPLGTGESEGRRYRTWLSVDGALHTAVAASGEVSGAWEVWSWGMTGAREMVAFPLATVCFDDHLVPSTARSC